MASCGLVTFISILCNKQFAGSHFAIFSSLAVLLNSTMSGFAGSIVKAVGWDWFFFIDFSISIPPLFIIIYLVINLIKLLPQNYLISSFNGLIFKIGRVTALLNPFWKLSNLRSVESLIDILFRLQHYITYSSFF